MMKKLVLGVLGLLSLSACKDVAVSDGKVPAEYQALAAKFTGEFSGRWAVEGRGSDRAKRDATLNLTMDETGLLAIQTSVDPLADGCNSNIGELTSINIDDSSNPAKINYLTFNFSAGICKKLADGTHLTLYLEEAELKATIHRKTKTAHSKLHGATSHSIRSVGRFARKTL